MCLAIQDGRRKRVGWLAIAALFAAIVALVALGVQVRDEGPQRMIAGDWDAGVGIGLTPICSGSRSRCSRSGYYWRR